MCGGALTLLSFAGGLNGVLVVGLAINALTVPAIGFGVRRRKPANPRPWRLLQLAVGLLLLCNLLTAPDLTVLNGIADVTGALGYAVYILSLIHI